MTSSKFLRASILGGLFGFLLQKGGVAKFHILVGALLLEDFTVVKIMMSAVTVGMVGVLWLKQKGVIKVENEPFRWRRAVIGGLIFGIGFAFSGYCPGTGAAAVGQLNGDALFMVFGMLAGSYLFALSSDRIMAMENARDLRLPDLAKCSEVAFTLRFAAALAFFLLLLEVLT